jgi:hypothetical protein
MRKFMINGLHPHSFAIVDAAPLPVFRMDEVDAPILEGPSGGAAPINVFVPFDPRAPDCVKVAKIRNCPSKRNRTIVLEKRGELAIDFAPLHNWGN